MPSLSRHDSSNELVFAAYRLFRIRRIRCRVVHKNRSDAILTQPEGCQHNHWSMMASEAVDPPSRGLPESCGTGYVLYVQRRQRHGDGRLWDTVPLTQSVK